MQWLSEECQRPLYTQLLLQEGHGQWEPVEPKRIKKYVENITKENIWWNAQSDTIFEVITRHNTIFTEQYL